MQPMFGYFNFLRNYLNILNIMKIYQLIYKSRASEKITQETLLKILKKAQENNERHQLSGFLIFKNNEFIQLLEGAKTDVLTIFNAIKDDSRHTDIEILLETNSKERAMAAWVMGYGSSDQEYDLLRAEDFHISMAETRSLCDMMTGEMKAIFQGYLQTSDHPTKPV